MREGARIAAAIEVLDHILDGMTAERALKDWARRSRFAGSKDRAALRDLVFGALRCKRSFAALGGAMTGRGLMIGALRDQGADLESLMTGQGHDPAPLADGEESRPPEKGAEAADVPDWLYDQMVADLGPDAQAAFAALRARAPVFVRVNETRAVREDVQALLLDEGIASTLHPKVKTALEVTENARKISTSAPYMAGLIELQDASSQAAVLRIPMNAGDRVLDYCAGGGGKALALAARGAVVTAHDIAPHRMADIPERAARAGVEIAVSSTQSLPDDFDLVVVDAPCSGSGTWRRDPEGKWVLTQDRLNELMQIQFEALSAAKRYLRRGGRLVYMTCSVLQCENEAVIARFVQAHAGWSCADQMRWVPDAHGDGFFFACLEAT